MQFLVLVAWVQKPNTQNWWKKIAAKQNSTVRWVDKSIVIVAKSRSLRKVATWLSEKKQKTHQSISLKNAGAQNKKKMAE